MKDGMQERIRQRVKEKKAISDAGLPPPSERKHWRDAIGLTQADAASVLSEESGKSITRPQFANWELGICNPRPDVLPYYVEFLKACVQIKDSTNK